LLQAIAAEIGFPETAFFVPKENGFHLRWFTPTIEIDLCGHATLATAFILYSQLGYKSDSISFDSLSGILTVARSGRRLTLDFPGRRVEVCAPPRALLDSLQMQPVEVLESGDQTYIAVYANESDVENFEPNFEKLLKVGRCVNITAPGLNSDFVSRFFGPTIGIPEDPVTGSAHCGLAIYWSRRLKRTDVLRAVQLSKRRGEVFTQVKGDRVLLSGDAVLILKGELEL
jgi:PhzF family phenazine biosynthesis protein